MTAPKQTITELFTKYLKDQVAAREQGLGFDIADEVVPYEAVPVQPVDPRLAWNDAVAAVKLFPGVDVKSWPAPPEWPGLVSAQEPAVALAFCVGNFPQLVRNLQPLLAGGDLAALRVNNTPAISNHVEPSQARQPAELIVAAATSRLTRHFDQAETLLKKVTVWQPLLANETAALAWHRGRFDEAAALWRTQTASAPVLFNRGMAALFLGDTTTARTNLDQAVQMLPDTNAWHHLGRLYLALADARG